MNAFIVILLAAIACWAIFTIVRKARCGGGCCGEHEAAETRVKVADRSKANYSYEVQLTIGGMTCENCARKVENALNRLDGTWASVKISSHQAQLLSKQAPDESQIRRTVQQAGYVVTGYKLLRSAAAQ